MKILTIGIGCRRGARLAQIEAAVRAALEAIGPFAQASFGMPEPARADSAGRVGEVGEAGDPVDAYMWAYVRAYVSCVASIDAKADEPGLLAFCAAHGLPLRLYSRRAIGESGSADVFPASALSAPSEAVRARFGVNGICEPCALLASAPGGRLLVAKTVLDGVAVAIAGAD